jgi:alkylhydroperoxidase/carboxymuconolactone decarboxylase family protein YurZ
MSAKIPETIAQKIQAFCDNRAAGDENLNRSNVYRQLVDQTNKFLQSPQRKEGLDLKQRVMVLLGIHATHGTEQSIHFSVTGALQSGCSPEQVQEALDLALLTGGGQAVSRVQFAANVLEFYRGSPSALGKKTILAFAEQGQQGQRG